MPDKAEQLKRILEILKEDTVSKETFVALVSQIVDVVKQTMETTKTQSAESQQRLEAAVERLRLDRDRALREVTGDAEERVNLLVDQILKVLANVRDGTDGRDGQNGRDGRDGTNGRDGKDADVEEIITEVINRLPKTEKEPTTFFPFIPPKPRVYYYDLTSQCDGSTKTFRVPLNFGIIGVFSTQAPIIYRPLIDWTEGNRTLTLTDQVGAPQSGQTLWCQYLK